MLKDIDLARQLGKDEYKRAKQNFERKLTLLQRQVVEKKVPVLIVFEGWDAAGKGTLINELIAPLDPRGYQVVSTFAPNEEESLRPLMWRFWVRTPASGRLAMFDRSWYSRLLHERVDGKRRKSEVRDLCTAASSFERQLADDGNVIIKFFLHISKKEQKKRFAKLRKGSTTEWRVTKDDLKRHRQYDKYRDAMDEIIAATDSGVAPWTIVEAQDRRFAAVKIFETVVRRLDSHLRGLEAAQAGKAKEAVKVAGKGKGKGKNRVEVSENVPATGEGGSTDSSILDRVDTSLCLAKAKYDELLEARQKELRDLEHVIYVRRMPVVIVYEGWDAAGKGGNIRRLVQRLDPRGYEVVPVAAPNDEERAHHYLWRFWRRFPKAGHITIFDRSWYGRVLVERVEGFCSAEAWRRAYREINEMEQQMADFGAVMVKFWLHIDPDEQLRRFREREKIQYKQWKITAEDWRNRAKWPEYKAAVDEMLFRTSTPYAPWTVVESNCKYHARLKALETVIKAIKTRIAD